VWDKALGKYQVCPGTASDEEEGFISGDGSRNGGYGATHHRYGLKLDEFFYSPILLK
jgi:hypothetical protein